MGTEGKGCKALVMPNIFLGKEAPADQGRPPRSSHRLPRTEYKLRGVIGATREEADQKHGMFSCGEGIS